MLRWTSDADLNLVVAQQPGDPLELLDRAEFLSDTEVLYPGFGLERSDSGGRIAFDHRGGPSGGQEIAFWADQFPTGLYSINTLNTDDTPVAFKWNAFLDGRPISILAERLDENGNVVTETVRDPQTGMLVEVPVLDIETQIERTVRPGQSINALIPVPPIFDTEPGGGSQAVRAATGSGPVEATMTTEAAQRDARRRAAEARRGARDRADALDQDLGQQSRQLKGFSARELQVSPRFSDHPVHDTGARH